MSMLSGSVEAAMSQFFEIHPDNPQARLIHRTIELLRDGAVIVYPTDSCYALGCAIGEKTAMERICRIRRLDNKHHFTLVCRDLSEIANYVKVDNSAYRLLKAFTPGPYTFILRATHKVPRRLQQPKRKTIGIRIPDNTIAQQILAELDEPMMSTSLILPKHTLPMVDPNEMRDRLEHEVDLIIDGGPCGIEETSVIDLVSGSPQVIRRGKGDTQLFEE